MAGTTDFDSDSMLSFMTELKNSFVELRKEMGAFQDKAGEGIHKTSDETDRFGKTVEKHSKHVEDMGLQFGRLGGLVRGLGIGAGVAYTAFQQMSEHGVPWLQASTMASADHSGGNVGSC